MCAVFVMFLALWAVVSHLRWTEGAGCGSTGGNGCWRRSSELLQAGWGAVCRQWRRRKRASQHRAARYLAEQMASEKIHLAHRFLQYTAGITMVGVIMLVYNMWMRNRRWMNGFGMWGMLVGFLVLVMLLLLPTFLRAYSLDPLCVIFHVLMGFWLSPWTISIENLFTLHTITFVTISIPVCTFAQHYTVLFLCQLSILALMVGRVVQEEFPLAEGRIGNPQTLIIVHLFFMGVGLVVHLLANSALRQHVESKIREGDSKTQLNAASALLELTCDAVVHLDEDFRIKSDSPQLAAMLFRQPETLKGTKFTDFIAAADAERAAEDLLAGSRASAPAHAFHTNLVDGCSSKFRTEVFQVKYTKMNGQKYHLLGLRDFTDVKPLAIDPQNAMARAARERSGSDDSQLDWRSYEMRSFTMHEAPPQELSAVPPDTDSATSRVLSNGIVEHCLQIGDKNAFLDINVAEKLVSAASAPCADVVGQSLCDIFPNSFTLDIIDRLYEDARAARRAARASQGTLAKQEDVPTHLPDQVAAFEAMPLFLAHVPPQYFEISGVMKVVLQDTGQLHVILSFGQPVSRSDMASWPPRKEVPHSLPVSVGPRTASASL